MSANERNIATFDADVERYGGYVYTTVERWSTRLATEKQTDGILRVLERNFPRSIRIADIGCGDGVYTVQIARRFQPASIRGIDPAEAAIEAAARRIPSDLAGVIRFETGNIYDAQSHTGEIAIVRGVLHHLDDPRAAIAQLGRHFRAVIALEPNGYNPLLKIIEKTSAYHREHEEKSYWPPKLNDWFKESGFSVERQEFFGVVPYFCPTAAAKALKAVEPLVEALPLIRQILCGTNLILYRKG